MIATTDRPHDSISDITFFVMGNISDALVCEQGRDHLVNRLEIIKPSMVLAALLGLFDDPIIFPP